MPDTATEKEKAFDPHEALLVIDHQPLDEVETLGRKLYSDLFLDTARDGRKPMHDGCEARFYPDTFDHAFYRSPGDYVLIALRSFKIKMTPDSIWFRGRNRV